MSQARTLQNKFADLSAGMQLRLVERPEEIDIFGLALLAKTHAFFLGEPGIAKSLLIETGIGLIDGLDPEDYFHLLFMKSTTREDVFGPLDLKLLRDGHYYYKPEGFLPAAKLGFGDEFWKASGAIQNTCLWALNEGLYRNDGKVTTLPLWSFFIASNEMPPEGEGLEAIYDRFPLRRVSQGIVEPGSFINMLQLSAGPQATHAKVIKWTEIEQAHAEVRAVRLPGDVLEALAEVRQKLKDESIFPSDRRFAQSLKIVQAAAWRDGEQEADIEHLRSLRHVLWNDPKEAPKVEEILTDLANPLDTEIGRIMADLGKLNREVDNVTQDTVDEERRLQTGSQVFDKVETARDELVAIAQQLKGSRRRSAKLHGATTMVSNLTRRVLVDIFHTTEEQVKKKVNQFATDIEGTP